MEWRRDLQRAWRDVPIILVVGLNLVPLAGVLFFGWRVLDTVFFFWLETAIIGAYSIVALCMAARRGIEYVETAFWTVWLSGIVGLQLLFTLLVIGPEGVTRPHLSAFAVTPGLLRALAFPALIVVVTHGIAFVVQEVRRGRREVPERQMNLTLQRVVVLHFALVIGGIATAAAGSPMPMLVALVLVKAAADLYTRSPKPKEPAAVTVGPEAGPPFIVAVDGAPAAAPTLPEKGPE